MQPTNVQINQADCIRSTAYLDRTVYTNVCTGARVEVLRGPIDSLFLVAGPVLFLVVLWVVARASFRVLRD